MVYDTATPMLLDDVVPFLDEIFVRLLRRELDVSSYELDHIGYQASSQRDYLRLRESAQRIGDLIVENSVEGRAVGLIALRSPIIYRDHAIGALEIIAPKPGQICPSAWEHAEFVIDESFETVMGRYPDFDWDTSAKDREQFPMVKLPLGDHLQVKFHHQHILALFQKYKYK